MSWITVFLSILIVLIKQSIEDDTRSVEMSEKNGQQFQCANTTCSPFITYTVSTVRECQLECLANRQCQAASFYQSTSNCQLFNNMINQTGNMFSQADAISMIVITGTRIPLSAATTIPPPTLLNPCSNGIYWNVTRSTVAGTGTAGNTSNQLNNPYGIYLDASDTLYISDFNNHRVMKYLYGASNGTIIAGITGISGSSSNQLFKPIYVYVDSSQTLYVADSSNNRVMRWLSGASTGSIVAGNGIAGSSLNQLYGPSGLWIDSSSNVFVVDFNNHRVTRWSLNASSGVVIAGVTMISGLTPDRLDYPSGLFYDEVNQDLYISNWGGQTIIRWHIGDSNGTVIAGVPALIGSTSVRLTYPLGITVDQWKNLYVADSGNSRVQLFCSGNTTGATIAGTGSGGSSLSSPRDVKFDSQMNLYVSEYNGHRVTKFNKL